MCHECDIGLYMCAHAEHLHAIFNVNLGCPVAVCIFHQFVPRWHISEWQKHPQLLLTLPCKLFLRHPPSSLSTDNLTQTSSSLAQHFWTNLRYQADHRPPTSCNSNDYTGSAYLFAFCQCKAKHTYDHTSTLPNAMLAMIQCHAA